jgi:hypothetical protein
MAKSNDFLFALLMEKGAFRMNSKISFNIGIMGTRLIVETSLKAFL